VAQNGLEKLHKESFFGRHGINSAELAQVPKSLKQLHKFMACLCMVTVGVQVWNFNQGLVCNMFSTKIGNRRDITDSSLRDATRKSVYYDSDMILERMALQNK
jgi:hypothetical protein